MIKKIAILLGSFSVLTLVGCGNEQVNDEYTPEEETGYLNEPEEDYVPDITMQMPEAAYHEVMPGQNLDIIAQMYGISVDLIRDFNDLSPDEYVVVGDVLRLPYGAELVFSYDDLDFDININFADEFIVADIVWNYARYRETVVDYTKNVLFTTTDILTDFAILEVRFDDDLLNPEVLDILFTTDELNAERTLLIVDYYDYSTIPRIAFSFVDELGMRRFFTFIVDQMDGYSFIINEFTVSEFTMLD